MNEADVREFWQAHPCGDQQVGGLEVSFARDYESFFRRYDEFRYRREAHILQCLRRIDFGGRKVLEIGLGQGADSEQIIRQGARWSGLDLTAESVARVATRLKLRQLPFNDIKHGSALDIPYRDESFDIVFSHGVLHHIPEVRKASAEIARVLRPDGELVIMVYAKWSFNYLVSISIIRRLGLLGLHLLDLEPRGIYGEHLRAARRMGVAQYLKMKNFLHRSTDGPLNPYSKVYGLSDVAEDLPDFQIVHSYKRWMHGPPLPVSGIPLGWLMGWHLWVHLKPRKGEVVPGPR